MTDKEANAIRRLNDVWIMETAAIATGDKPAVEKYSMLKRQMKALLEDMGYALTWDREKGYGIAEA